VVSRELAERSNHERDMCMRLVRLRAKPALGSYELMSIVNYAIPYPGPTIHSAFTNTKASLYWSSTYAYDPVSACYVYFNSGYVFATSKSSTFYVRCVRGGQ